jgi:hypothetical protein
MTKDCKYDTAAENEDEEEDMETVDPRDYFANSD